MQDAVGFHLLLLHCPEECSCRGPRSPWLPPSLHAGGLSSLPQLLSFEVFRYGVSSRKR